MVRKIPNVVLLPTDKTTRNDSTPKKEKKREIITILSQGVKDEGLSQVVNIEHNSCHYAIHLEGKCKDLVVNRILLAAKNKHFIVRTLIVMKCNEL